MEVERAIERIVEIARNHGGLVTAAEVESDQELAADPQVVSAAAYKLASATNVFADASEDETGGWFPYSEIRFTDLRG
jgi:hypothetical protein